MRLSALRTGKILFSNSAVVSFIHSWPKKVFYLEIKFEIVLNSANKDSIKRTETTIKSVFDTKSNITISCS